MNEHIWVEKYRPKNIEELILPEDIKNTFRKYIDDGKVPNILLSSNTPGLGKTSLAKVLVNELDADMLFLNGNRETGIDIFRDKLLDFCSSVSVDGSPKIVFIDEFENVSAYAQDSAKSTIEQFTNVSFIATANYPEKLSEAIRNRLIHYDFDTIYFENKKEIAKEILKKLVFICEQENIEYKKEDLLEIIKVCYPSVRGMIKNLQQFSTSSKLILTDKLKDQGNIFNILIDNIKNKDFGEMRQNITKIVDPGSFYTYCFKNLDMFEDKIKPLAIINLAKYQDMDSKARDKVLNLGACCTELMMITNK